MEQLLSSFPGRLPLHASMLPTTSNNILTQMQQDWALHSALIVDFVQRTMRYLTRVELCSDSASLEDYLRTSRFDIASHYNRSLHVSEPSPITLPDEIIYPSGRQLAVLLDQHISILKAMVVKTLDFNNLFCKADQKAKVQSRILLALALIHDESEYLAYDPIVELVANGKMILAVIANVHFNKHTGAVLHTEYFNQEALDFFNGAIFNECNSTAEEMWNEYLTAIAALIGKETTYDKKQGELSLVELSELSSCARDVRLRGFKLGKLFAFSVTDGAGDAFPV